VRDDSWAIMKCFDDEVDGFPVQDMLREFLLQGEESVNAGLLEEADTREFLWHLFRHLALGGAMNQFEDDLTKYREASKALYKSLVSCAITILDIVMLMSIVQFGGIASLHAEFSMVPRCASAKLGNAPPDHAGCRRGVLVRQRLPLWCTRSHNWKCHLDRSCSRRKLATASATS
jgi:Domain of unknown function (DUF4498)